MSVPRAAGLLAVLIAALAVVTLVLANVPESQPRRNVRPRRVVVQARQVAPRRTAPRRAAPRQEPRPMPPAVATALESRGHDLLAAGDYSAALPVLRQAVAATGVLPGTCLEPRQPGCLIYAFALYDLGRALRLSGDPQAAVAILQRRIQIDNYRSIVAYELQLARQEAG